jgi:Xaa-Pro aminopeptidase
MNNLSDYYMSRIDRLQLKLQDDNLNGVILVPGSNLRYYTGSQSIMMERIYMLFIPSRGQPNLVVPDFEAGEFMEQSIVLHKWNDKDGPSSSLRDVSEKLPIKGRWGLEGRVPFMFLNPLMKYAKPELVDAEPILQKMRAIKDDTEIKILQKSAKILGKSYLKMKNFLKPGMSEIELARSITADIYSNGAQSVAVVLIQAGERAADPHSLPSSRKIKRNEPVVVDISSTCLGYFADITRTIALGRGVKFESQYHSVLEAQRTAIKAAKPRATVGSVDAAARNHLRNDKLAEYFLTRTGHGLGLDIHEPPYIVAGGSETLQPGMVHTIEPGIYIRKNMGIRIEDDLLITTDGNRVMSAMVPTDFDWWN